MGLAINKNTMKYRLAAILITLVFNSIAQVNLVPNPSFEEYSQCPDDQGQIAYAIGWTDGISTFGSEYFNSCSSNILSSVPQNAVGFQQPNSGNAYSGFFVFTDNTISGENLQTHLSTTLVKNKKYCIEFYISLADNSSYYINNIGCYFTNDPLNVTVPSLSIYTPQYTNTTNSLNDSNGWAHFTGDFIAVGGEEYLTIANFQSFSEIDTVFIGFPLGVNQKQCYFYVDDVSVICCDPTGCDEIIIPNIFTPNSDGINDIFQIEFLPANSKLAIYSRWGNQVYQSDNYQNNWDGQNHSPGVYYYILTLPSGNTKKGTVTLLRD
jgi:gliding motility-associated-like protein